MGMKFYCNCCGKETNREELSRMGEWTYPYKKYDVSTIDTLTAVSYSNKCTNDPINIQTGYDYCPECRKNLVNWIDLFKKNGPTLYTGNMRSCEIIIKGVSNGN